MLAEELVLFLRQGWIGSLPESQLSLAQRLQHHQVLTHPAVFSAFASTDRSWFTQDPQPYANLPHALAGGEKMTIPSMHVLALEVLRPCVGPETKKVLDLGCGAGYLTHCLGKMAPNGQILGIDINQRLIEQALLVPNAPANVSFRRADVKEIIDDEYDAIHVGFNITHALSAELSMKLRTGGLLWAPVMSADDQSVAVCLIDKEGGSKKVIDMEYSPLRQPSADFEEKLKAIEQEIKGIYEDLQKRLGKSITLKDFPPKLPILLKERKILMAKIKRLSS